MCPLPDRWSKPAVEQELARELRRTWDAYCAANDEFQAWVEDLGDIPFPDGNLQVTHAYRAYKGAEEEWKAALGRWSEFVTQGKVPEDLRKLAR